MTTTLLADLADVECRHGMTAAWCSTCKAEHGYKPGSTRQHNDCSVKAIAEATDLDYATAEWLMAECGRRNGRGVNTATITTALDVAGFTAVAVVTSLAHAIERSRHGARYIVVAWEGRRNGHAYAVRDGRTIEAGRIARTATRQTILRIERTAQ